MKEHMLRDYATGMLYELWLHEPALPKFDVDDLREFIEQNPRSVLSFFLMYADTKRIQAFVENYRVLVSPEERIAQFLYLYRRDLLANDQQLHPDNWRDYVHAACLDARPFHESGFSAYFRGTLWELQSHKPINWQNVMDHVLLLKLHED